MLRLTAISLFGISGLLLYAMKLLAQAATPSQIGTQDGLMLLFLTTLIGAVGAMWLDRRNDRKEHRADIKEMYSDFESKLEKKDAAHKLALTEAWTEAKRQAEALLAEVRQAAERTD